MSHFKAFYILLIASLSTICLTSEADAKSLGKAKRVLGLGQADNQLAIGYIIPIAADPNKPFT